MFEAGDISAVGTTIAAVLAAGAAIVMLMKGFSLGKRGVNKV
jgi:hypothetical protein